MCIDVSNIGHLPCVARSQEIVLILDKVQRIRCSEAASSAAMACLDTKGGPGQGVWPGEEGFYDKSENSDGFESLSDAESDSSNTILEFGRFHNDEENENFGVNVNNVETMVKHSKLVTRLQSLNNFSLEDAVSQGYIPLVCDNVTVGLVSPEVVSKLQRFSAVFRIAEDRLSFVSEVDSGVMARTRALDSVMRELRDRGMFSSALRGWRDECYEIRNRFQDPALFSLERAASPLLGVRKYGIQINGYVRHSGLGLCLWLQKRSVLKPTWPGMMDNFVGGGVTEGLGVAETAVKEAAEEAGLNADLASKLVSAGSVSFLHRTERGLHPNTEFVFDLELPESFVPHNTDGEVGGWTLVPVDMIVEVVCSDKFKITSVPVVVDFLMRHGLLNPDADLIKMLRFPLDILYKYFNVLH